MSYVSQEFFDAMWTMVKEKPERISFDYCPTCDQDDAACVKPRWLRAVAYRMGSELSFRWNRACLQCGWVSIQTPIKNKKLRASVFEADSNECAYCGATQQLGIDHVIPQTHGGKHIFENLLTCCHSCNAIKRDRHKLTPQYGRYRNT